MPILALTLDQVDGAEGARSWIEVTRTGKFVSPVYGKFTITKADLATMLRNFEQITPEAPTELSVDYNHLAIAPKTPEQGKAAGWVKDLELRGDGDELWALVEWTPPAVTAIANKEYRYVSAHFAFNHTHIDGREIGPTLLSIGITNRPFVEGMAPMTVAANKDVAFALADDEAAEGKFSFDEIRRRLNDAVRMAFGKIRVYDWGESNDCWLCDVYDAFCIFRQEDSTYRVDYTLGDDGVITFTNEPIEVVNNWTPVAAAALAHREGQMPIKFTDVNGKAVEISDEAFQAELTRRGPAAGGVQLSQVQTELTTTKAELATAKQDAIALTARTLALETTLKERDLNTKIDGFIKLGKATQAERPAMVKLGMKDESLFDELYGSRAAVVHLNRAIGSGEDVAASGTTATQRVEAAATKLIEKDAKLTRADANALAFAQDPALYEEYRKESSIRV